MNILEEAGQITSQDRNRDYGTPLANHGTTAGFLNVYMAAIGDRPLDARDVCWFNILQKCARDTHRRKRDNLVDTAGYARNAEMIDDALSKEPVDNVSCAIQC